MPAWILFISFMTECFSSKHLTSFYCVHFPQQITLLHNRLGAIKSDSVIFIASLSPSLALLFCQILIMFNDTKMMNYQKQCFQCCVMAMSWVSFFFQFPPSFLIEFERMLMRTLSEMPLLV